MNKNLFLLVEENISSVEAEKVLIEKNGKKEKQYITTGRTIYYGGVNQNNRHYPKEIMEEAVEKYKQKRMGKNFTALGELDHPISEEESMNIEFKKASHKFLDIWDGNDGWFYTKAKIIGTPTGNIAKVLVDEGISLGISTRGLGEIEEDYDRGCDRVSQYELLTAGDFVSEPSAPNAFLEVVKEGKYPIHSIDEFIHIKKFVDKVDKNYKINRNRDNNRKMLNEAWSKLLKEI